MMWLRIRVSPYKTKLENESRFDAAHRAAKNKIGRVVKIADNEDNSDISRITNPTEKDYERIREYMAVRTILEESI
jgi:GTP diphosphokinase / guanosine-3',5'-bis(diphosphate) 3'-diphosphatase